MKICGLQKLTLTDYPGYLAAILFLEGCNFRCPFCQNSSLVLPARSTFDKEMPDSFSRQNQSNPEIPLDSVLQFLKKRSGILEGVCISGGEPTLHRELPDLIRQIHDLGYRVKLDTNGTNPDMLEYLLSEHLLDYVAMDIKAGRNHYDKIAGIKNSSLCASLEAAVNRSVFILMSSSIDHEFRTTVVRGLHTEEDFEDIASWISGCPKYFLQAFRDCDSILMPDHPFTAFSEEEMHHFLDIVKKNIPNAAIRGDE